jgi:hypothetical protein
LIVASSTGTYGGSISLTATLSSGSPPVGGKTLSFTLNGVNVGTATTDANGVATLSGVSLSGIDASSYPDGIGASFAGDSMHAASSATGSLSVDKAPGGVAINNLPATAAIGTTLTLSYSKLGDGVPSTVSLTPAVCTVTNDVVSFVALGTCQLQASITEGTNYEAAAGSIQIVTVTRTITTTTLTSSVNPSTVGQSVTFTATVTPGTPSGIVLFRDGDTTLAAVPLINGVALFTTSALSLGSHQIVAWYTGAPTANASTSAVLTQTISAPKTATSTSLIRSVNPAKVGQYVTLTAQVNPSAATGTITFMDGTSVLGSATLINGSARITVQWNAPGSHLLSAVYSGNSTYAASRSATLPLIVLAS